MQLRARPAGKPRYSEIKSISLPVHLADLEAHRLADPQARAWIVSSTRGACPGVHWQQGGKSPRGGNSSSAIAATGSGTTSVREVRERASVGSNIGCVRRRSPGGSGLTDGSRGCTRDRGAARRRSRGAVVQHAVLTLRSSCCFRDCISESHDCLQLLDARMHALAEAGFVVIDSDGARRIRSCGRRTSIGLGCWGVQRHTVAR